jgi:hypothetical protein
MSDLLLPPGYINTVLYWRSANSPRIALTTIAAQVTTPPFTSTSATTLFTAITGALDQDWDSQTAWPQMVTLANNSGVINRYVNLGTVTGTHVAFEECPPNVAAVIGKETLLAGRTHRGRIFIPFIDESRVDASGKLFTAYQTALQTVANNLYTAFSTSGGGNLSTPVVLHTTSEPPTPVVNFQVQTIVSTQRRRLSRVTV